MAERIMEMPDSDFCYYLGSPFKDNATYCPDYRVGDHMHPLCNKYNEALTWNTSGRVLKCAGCLQEDK